MRTRSSSALVAAEDRGAVLVALERIPSRCQELLRLLVVEPALSYDDIAAAMDVPRGWIGPDPGALHQPPATSAGRGPPGRGVKWREERIRPARVALVTVKEADR